MNISGLGKYVDRLNYINLSTVCVLFKIYDHLLRY